MISIRKLWWAALAASALAGCSHNTEQSTTAAPPPVTPGPAPETPPATKSGGTTAEMNPPASSAPTSENMPKTTAPEATSKPEPADIEGPKIEGPAPIPAKPEEKKADAAQDGTAGEVALSDEEIAEIEKLPEADAALALKQKVCPVSGEHLGGEMGVPVKVSAEGKTFFLCCKGCNKGVKANPKAVVAKLKQ